jgi:hypothetical protein
VAYGITVKNDHGGSRIEIRAQNQAGLLYAVPAPASWVATPEQLPAHALAGFLNELVALESPQIEELMKKWGLYFRPLTLDGEEEGD